jgi:hypothetical protein
VTVIDEMLQEGERVEHRASMHPMPLYAVGFMALCVAAAGIWLWSQLWWGLLIVALVGARFGFQLANTKIVVTDRRLLMRSGAVEAETAELRLDRVESVTTKGNAEVGTVTVVGSGGSRHVFENVKDPETLRRAVNRSADAARGVQVDARTAV